MTAPEIPIAEMMVAKLIGDLVGWGVGWGAGTVGLGGWPGLSTPDTCV